MILLRRLILAVQLQLFLLSGDEISLKFTENLATFTDDNTDVMDQFTVKVNGVEATIDAVSLSGNNTVVLGVDTSIETNAMR